MKVKVRGHFARRKIGERVVVDETNPANEMTVPIYVEIYVDPHEKNITPRKRGNDGRFKRNP